MSNEQGNWAIQFGEDTLSMSVRIQVGNGPPLVFPMSATEVKALVKWVGVNAAQVKSQSGSDGGDRSGAQRA